MGAIVIDVLKQLVTRQIAAAFYDGREPLVAQIECVDLAGLASKLKMKLGALSLDVTVAHGSKSCVMVQEIHAIGIANTNSKISWVLSGSIATGGILLRSLESIELFLFQGSIALGAQWGREIIRFEPRFPAITREHVRTSSPYGYE